MVIAFDIDGTITRCPEFFRLVSRALLAAGHKVIVITFRDDRAMTEADLRRWGVVCNELFVWGPRAMAGHDADAWKAAICREHGVEVFFEDDPFVADSLPESVVCMMPLSAKNREAAGRING